MEKKAHIVFWGLLKIAKKKQYLACITTYYDDKHPSYY